MRGGPAPARPARWLAGCVYWISAWGVVAAPSAAAAASTAPAPAPPPAAVSPTVAVLYLDVHSQDPALMELRKGLAAMLITDLEGAGARLVERGRLEEVLAEQKLQRSARVDPASASRLGRLLGARAVVMGSLAVVGAQVRLDARLVDVETGAILASAKATGSSDDILAIETTLAAALRDKLRVAWPQRPGSAAPAPAAGRRLRRPARLPGAALRQYGAALDAADRGDKAAARKGLAQVVHDHPAFELAYLDLQSLGP